MLNTPKHWLFQELRSAADRDNGKSSTCYVTVPVFLIKSRKPNILLSDLMILRETCFVSGYRTSYLQRQRKPFIIGVCSVWLLAHIRICIDIHYVFWQIKDKTRIYPRFLSFDLDINLQRLNFSS